MSDEQETAREQRDEREDEDGEDRAVASVERRRVIGRPFEPGNPFRFPPGQSGNPSGRPVGIGPLIDKVLAEEIDTKGDLGKREALELMVRSVVRTALKGGSSGTAAFRELMDRRFGRVPLSVRLGPEEDSSAPTALRIRIVDRDDVEREARLAPVKGGGNGNGNGDGLA